MKQVMFGLYGFSATFAMLSFLVGGLLGLVAHTLWRQL